MKRTSPKSLTKIKCEVCGESTLKDSYQIKRNKHHYCSKACLNDGLKKRVELTCATCKETFERAKCFVRMGQNTYCGNVCRYLGKRSQATWNKGLIIGPNPKISGEHHWNWKGGVDKFRDNPLYWKIRFHKKNLQWRTMILERDGYECTRCLGENKSELHVHHIIPFVTLFEEFFIRYNQEKDLTEQLDQYEKFWATANGLTLCENCHIKIERRSDRN